MSNYPIWWDTTLTIYNKYEDPTTHVVRWFRTVVTGAFWKYTGNKITIGKTVLETNDTICRIRKDARFLEYYDWINVPNDRMSNYFTLGIGDIIVKGKVTDTIDEYTSGKRSNDLIAKYTNSQRCIIVDEATVNTGPGRCYEHYYVKGTHGQLNY